MQPVRHLRQRVRAAGDQTALGNFRPSCFAQNLTGRRGIQLERRELFFAAGNVHFFEERDGLLDERLHIRRYPASKRHSRDNTQTKSLRRNLIFARLRRWRRRERRPGAFGGAGVAHLLGFLIQVNAASFRAARYQPVTTRFAAAIAARIRDAGFGGFD